MSEPAWAPHLSLSRAADPSSGPVLPHEFRFEMIARSRFCRLRRRSGVLTVSDDLEMRVIPSPIAQNPCAHLHSPLDMITPTSVREITNESALQGLGKRPYRG